LSETLEKIITSYTMPWLQVMIPGLRPPSCESSFRHMALS